MGLSIAVFSSRYISIHAPRTGSDGIRHPSAGEGRAISIHAPRTGSDQVSVADALDVMDFNPRSPHGERRQSHGASRRSDQQFQSTLPARGATTPLVPGITYSCISIHAPRTGSDSHRVLHAAHCLVFQSTLPARGATIFLMQHVIGDCEISIHAPRTGSDLTSAILRLIAAISIHAPRTGSDMCRGWSFKKLLSISIHAPRTGSDSPPRQSYRRWCNFNPRSPHGERLSLLLSTCLFYSISIHAPRTGSDRNLEDWEIRLIISIHAPRTGSDLAIAGEALPASTAFQSTLPARGATWLLHHRLLCGSFQSTLPARGATGVVQNVANAALFQSTLPARGATIFAILTIFPSHISIHAPRTGSDPF